MRTFFLTILFVFAILISGCSNKEVKTLPDAEGGLKNPDTAPTNSSNMTDENLPELPTNNPERTVSKPTKEMLTALGEKQNDIDTRWFFPDTYYVLTGQPKKFFETEIGKGTEDVLSSALNTIFQMQFPIDYSKIERFILAAAPQGVITFDETAADGTKNSRRSLALRRVNIFHLTEPIANSMLQKIWTSQSNTPLESVKRNIAGVEYYDLLSPKIPTDQIRAGILLPDDRTIVIFIMLTEDANKLFAAKSNVTSAAVERLSYLDVKSNALTLSASWEGIVAEPMRMTEIPFIGSILSNIGNENAIQFMQNFRAINLVVNPSAQVGKPMLTVRYDAIDNNGATKLYELFLGIHVTAQTAFAAMKDEAANSLPLSKETSVQLLKAIELEKTNDTGFYFRINKFDGFDTVLKSGFAETSDKLRLEKLMIRKIEQLKTLTDVSIQYDKLNKKFPQPIRDSDGKALLSWRVAILPLIGQQELYNNFNLKEPWDSPTNLKLVEKIPVIFLPVDGNIAKGKTQIQRFSSNETPLADANLTLSKVKQPLNTVLLIQTSAEHAIEWTKPDELIYEENKLNKICGDSFIGTTFSSTPIVQNFLPANNPQSKNQLAIFSAIIKGDPLPLQSPASNHNHDHNHNHNDHEHHDHDHDHNAPQTPPTPTVLPIITPNK
ncbi:MAG: DUF1559 domain-containing protein [Planctomycetaceae bacterium]|jgi:hypothetical protein|nr:DUF1559 domain-containing protein [Planctomycetaceae bacterium]